MEVGVRNSFRLIAIAAALGAFAVVAATPASAGKPAPGGIYKMEYEWDGMLDKARIKVYESGTGGNFSLPCAGIRRDRFDIKEDGTFKLEFGADAVLVKGNGRFGSKGRVRGEIKKIDTNGAECAAPGKFRGALADV
jgi:hypothetical protein